MNAPDCSRAWQAEAVEDGRLADVDAASFERHAAGCAVCTREVRALAVLRAAGARLPVPATGELDRRRQRAELLRRANALAVRAPRALPLRIAAGGGLALAAVALALALAWPPAVPRATPAGAARVAVPTFRIATSPGAQWQVLERGALLRLRAAAGRLELDVDKLRAGQRFLVALPDGELEVQGTRFSLEVQDGATLGVRVSEGRVALRLRGHPARTLNGGDAWPVERAGAAPAGELHGATDEATGGTALPARSRVHRARADAARATDVARGAPHGDPIADAGAQVAVAPPGAAGRDFAAAMSAFTAGDYGRAEQLFAGFERAHRSDARVEDALFLRIVAQQRRGQRGASRELAHEYLRRFPNGLRSAEAAQLAR